MSEHTPWKTGTDMFAAVHVYDAGGDRLTNEFMCGTEGWTETANLISAAPELLEALVGLLGQINHPSGFDPIHPKVCDAKERAYAAISKARGQS